MVPTRKVCDLHTFMGGQSFLTQVTNPPSVVILSYRTESLSDEDKNFLRQRYVPMADDYLVLSKSSPCWRWDI